ncbi:MAG: HK97 family phage prohead protease [Acidobacteria bacterium]|nr:HK97 family phage prohead protease [Acidobacteriota bacterium]
MTDQRAMVDMPTTAKAMSDHLMEDPPDGHGMDGADMSMSDMTKEHDAAHKDGSKHLHPFAKPRSLPLHTRRAREERVVYLDDIEVRADDGQPARIVGHPVVYDRWSEDLGGFREKVMPGALTKTLQESDIRVLFNHDPNFVLGRNRSGTAIFTDEAKRLRMECVPPDTQTIRDLVLEPMRRGDINQMSFAFRVAGPAFIREKRTDAIPAGTGEVWNADYTERELHALQMFDGSVVTFAAYPQTDVQVRSAMTEAGLDFDALAAFLARAGRGLTPTSSDRDLVEGSLAVLRAFIPASEPEPETVTTLTTPEAGRSLAHFKALLALEAASI